MKRQVIFKPWSSVSNSSTLPIVSSSSFLDLSRGGMWRMQEDARRLGSGGKMSLVFVGCHGDGVVGF